jgi:hypothetical protein
MITILSGDLDGSDAFNPTVEWDGFATDTFGGLGAHTVNTPSTQVPEPATMILLGSGLLSFLGFRKKFRN